MPANDLILCPAYRLLESGFVRLDEQDVPRELRRGMPVWAQRRVRVGIVAALVLDCCCQEITHVLLGTVPTTTVYRPIPLAEIARVAGEAIWLRLSQPEVEALPVRQAED